MVGGLLARGMVAGGLAGLIAVGFAHVFGEPQVDLAIAFEAAMRQAAGEAPEPELVSRAVQAGWGLLTAGLVYGAGLGGLFALVFAGCYGRVGGWTPRSLAMLLALAGFVAVVMAPQIKYPANPPAIGEDATIGLRTALYFEMIVICLAAGILATLLGRWLATRLRALDAGLLAAAAFVAVVVAAQAALPAVDEVPADFPAAVLWRFRIASLGMQAVLWTSLGLIYGPLAARFMQSSVVRMQGRHA